jgi:hypothetical protein
MYAECHETNMGIAKWRRYEYRATVSFIMVKSMKVYLSMLTSVRWTVTKYNVASLEAEYIISA